MMHWIETLMIWPPVCPGPQSFCPTNYMHNNYEKIHFIYLMVLRLKGLAQGLNSELTEHNDLLDRCRLNFCIILDYNNYPDKLFYF